MIVSYYYNYVGPGVICTGAIAVRIAWLLSLYNHRMKQPFSYILKQHIQTQTQTSKTLTWIFLCIAIIWLQSSIGYNLSIRRFNVVCWSRFAYFTPNTTVPLGSDGEYLDIYTIVDNFVTYLGSSMGSLRRCCWCVYIPNHG